MVFINVFWILLIWTPFKVVLIHQSSIYLVLLRYFEKGFQPIVYCCSFGNCCFCILTSEDWDALSALYWSTFYEILVTQNLLISLFFKNVFIRKIFFFIAQFWEFSSNWYSTFIILKLGIKVYLIRNKRWVNFCNFVERTTMIKANQNSSL